jgi:hypothetical protein
MGNLNAILSDLVNLNETELKEVITMAEWLLNKNINTVTENGEEEFYSVLSRELLNKGIGVMKYHSFINTSNNRLFRNGVNVINTFIDRHFRGNTKIERLKLYKMFSSLLISWLSTLNIPLTMGVIIKHMGKIPELFENEFPDYIRSGLAKAVVSL